MKSMTTSALSVMIGIAAISLGVIFPTISRAHCDTLDGPVVTEAKVALEKGDVTPVLKWVKSKNEDEIGKPAEKAVRERFGRLMSAKKHKDESVGAGREYVEAYVEYVHFVEGLHNTITAVGAHHEHAK